MANNLTMPESEEESVETDSDGDYHESTVNSSSRRRSRGGRESNIHKDRRASGRNRIRRMRAAELILGHIGDGPSFSVFHFDARH